MTGRRPHVVVAGGGIAGLAAAHRLASCGAEVDITLLESDHRLGGNIRTERIAGRPLDVGAEALLARVPAGVEMCRAVGLGDELVAPVTDQAYVWTDQLRPLPPRLMAGVPGGGGAVVRSGILSPAGLARAGLDLVLPDRLPAGDVSIGSVVRRRLGDQVLERLVDPLLGGIHAGNCDELSMRATAPQLQAALGRGHGLVRGLRALAAAAPGDPAAPVFLTLRGGLQDMVGALSESLGAVNVRTGIAVTDLQATDEGSPVRVALDGGEQLDADHVILAVPAFTASELLERDCPEAAAEMRAIRYASVATIALAYRPSALEGCPHGSGFLVARDRGSTITACTWSSSKWAQLAGDPALVKCSVGHAGDRSALDLDDERLIAAVRSDLSQAMGLDAEPLEQRVFRFERALPQYAVGHLERIARIEQALGDAAVSVCGAAYRGVGVASCIRDGQAAADASLAALGAAPRSGEASPAMISQ